MVFGIALLPGCYSFREESLLRCGNLDVSYLLRELREGGVAPDVPVSGLSAEIWVPKDQFPRAARIAERAQRAKRLKVYFSAAAAARLGQ